MSGKLSTKELIQSLQSTNDYKNQTKHYIDKALKQKYQLNKVKKQDYAREVDLLQSHLIETLPTFPADPMREILLRADIDTINQYCLTNKKAKQLCLDKAFWKDKFDYYNYYFPLVLEDFTYPKIFDFIDSQMKDVKTILKINAIEYHRVYNKTKGIIMVLIETMHADNLDDLFSQKLKRDKLGGMNFNEMIIQLSDKGYKVQLQKIKQKPIDLGYKTIQEIEKLFSYALTIIGICNDDLYVSFLSMDDEAFDYDDFTENYNDHNASIRAGLRRGLWEGMQIK